MLCTSENIDVFMEIYNKYVPHVYTPEPTMMSEIIQTIDLYDAVQYLPQIWSDIVVFDYVGRIKVINPFLLAMRKANLEEPILQNQFIKIGLLQIFC